MRSTARLFLSALFLPGDGCRHALEVAFAQGGGATTSLSGTVTDTSGAIIPGAQCCREEHVRRQHNSTLPPTRAAISACPALDPGTLHVTVTLMGFKTAVLNDVRVNAATPATVNVTSKSAASRRPSWSTAARDHADRRAAVSATIDIDQIPKLPTGSRNALDFVALLPGVNTPGGNRDTTINGLPQSAINITIDGMSVQDNT